MRRGVWKEATRPPPASAVNVRPSSAARTAEPWIAALRAAGKDVEASVYPGVDHAFHNDTSAARYDRAAAEAAWAATLAFFGRHLRP